MKSALVIQHVAFEDAGSLAPALERADYAVHYVEAPLTDFSRIDPLASDLVAVLGGPIAADDLSVFPFLAAETALVEARLAAGRPLLGICLGAQIMARALGAAVYPNAVKEIGWSSLSLSEAGRDSCLRHLEGPATPVLHWHGDTFDLPAGTELLASTPACAHQAFRRGDAALALQFHPEVTAQGLERWLVGHVVEIAATPGVSVSVLRAETRRYAAELERRARALFDSWLESLGRS